MIAGDGPIPLARFMALANAHYYGTRDPFGPAGDFVTAPEISQMFGELVGLALADLWDRAGRPAVRYAELGPGRGTLAADALRAMARVGLVPDVALVETSPVLRAAAATRVAQAEWHERVETLPVDRPLLVVANEFFDALPIRQFVRRADGWRERRVGEGFALVDGPIVDESVIAASLKAGAEGSVIELNPAAAATMATLGRKLAEAGGALLAIDYGYEGPRMGDTFQAVRAHRSVAPLATPGESDLTAHVDFTALLAAGTTAGCTAFGPLGQGTWLLALGLAGRAAALARAAPARGDEIAVAYRRLSHPDEMGELFKLVAIVAPGWPTPAGFA